MNTTDTNNAAVADARHTDHDSYRELIAAGLHAALKEPGF